MSELQDNRQEPRFVRRDEFEVVGIEGRTSQKSNRIPELWDAFGPREDDIPHREDLDVSYGLCFLDDGQEPGMTAEDVEFTALVGVEVSEVGELPEGMVSKKIPAGEYAVFTHKGAFFPDGLPNTYKYIYREWFRASQYKPAANYNFEHYNHYSFHGVNHPSTMIEIWVPVKYASR